MLKGPKFFCLAKVCATESKMVEITKNQKLIRFPKTRRKKLNITLVKKSWIQMK